MQRVKLGFENVRGIPRVCGALNRTHIEIELASGATSTDHYDKDDD